MIFSSLLAGQTFAQSATPPGAAASAERDAEPPPSGQLIVCQRRIQTNAPIVNWLDNPRFSAYQRACYRGPAGQAGWADPRPFRPARGMENRVIRYRPRKELMGHSEDLTILRHVIRQLVIHHDGVDNARESFHVLHDERGLSAHFLIDTDGTIYQTLDLADIAFHAQIVNGMSIGVELCNRGLTNLYASQSHRRHREPKTVTVHGHPYTMWSFTDAQYLSLSELCAQLVRIFPRLPLHAPQNGGPIYTCLAQPERFSGLLGHFHVSSQKWDPGCFDFARVMATVAGRRSFGLACGPTSAAWAAPERAELTSSVANPPHGGFFPVSRCGSELVWHGGIHLQRPRRAAVNALWPGKLVAARLHRPLQSFGSTNFVLTEHTLTAQGQDRRFFILYYHLDSPAASDEAPAWRRDKRSDAAERSTLPGVDVCFPNVEVLAGERLGSVGPAGPRSSSAPQLHLQVFAPDEVATALFPGHFEPRDCVGEGPLCADPVIHTLFPRSSPSTSSPPPGAEHAGLRRLALRFPSEWQLTTSAEFDRQLRRSAHYRQLAAGERAAIFCEQVQPAAWLDARVARALSLPPDARLWHYHPIEFLSQLCAQWDRAQPPPDASALIEATAGPNRGEADDGTKGDTGYVSEEDLTDWELGQGVELSTLELARGYPEGWLR